MSDLIARLRHEAIARSGYAHEYADGRTVWHPVCNEAADALEAKAKRIAELEDKLEDEEYVSKDTDEMFNEVRDENIELRARIAELEAALKPIMKISLLHVRPEVANAIRAARAAYLGEKE